MGKIIHLAAVAMLLSAVSATAEDKSVNYAYALCKVIDDTGLTSTPCEVSGWSSSVTTTIDMTSSEARKLCAQMASMVRQQGISFRNGWTLQIRSPYSGDKSIAFCPL